MNSEMDIDEAGGSAGVSDSIAVVEYSEKRSGIPLGREDVVMFLDTIDTRVEALRKDALKLQESRDQLLIRIEMLTTTDFLASLNQSDREDAFMHLKRINNRLQTVDINVQTVRDDTQIDSLNYINLFIDEVIRHSDPIMKRQKFQEYLNACSSDFHSDKMGGNVTSIMFVDKQFEGHLLGCTLDDQKRIKKRLNALLNYFVAQQVKASE